MKNLSVLIVALLFSMNIQAQDKNKSKEVGIFFKSTDSFGLSFKLGNTDSYWRFNTLFINGANFEDVFDSLSRTNKNNSFGIKIGKEFRKEIVENLEFRYGFDLSFSYSNYGRTETNLADSARNRTYENTTYSPGINLVLSVNYIIQNKIVVGTEIQPQFAYTYGNSTGYQYNYNTGVNEEVYSDIKGFSYGFNNGFAKISIAYKF